MQEHWSLGQDWLEIPSSFPFVSSLLDKPCGEPIPVKPALRLKRSSQERGFQGLV